MALVLLSACREEEKPTLQPPASLFDRDDLEPGRTLLLTTDEIEGRMANGVSLQATTTDADRSAFDQCIRDELRELTLTADEVNLKLDETLDVAGCETDPSVTVNEMSYRVRVWIGCKGRDVSGRDGERYGDSLDARRDCGDKDAYGVLVNLDVVLDADGTLTFTDENGTEQTVATSFRQRSRVALQTASGDPCENGHDGDEWAWSDDCRVVMRDSYERFTIGDRRSTLEGREDYARFTFNGIREADSGAPKWFSRGSLGVTVDDWSGSVTYYGATTPPTYTLTDGESTTTGTVGVQRELTRPATPCFGYPRSFKPSLEGTSWICAR